MIIVTSARMPWSNPAADGPGDLDPSPSPLARAP